MDERDLRGKATAETESLDREVAPIRGCRLVVIAGDDTGQSLELGAGSAVVGKSSSADLQLADASVSGRHLQVEIADDGLRVTDLDSTNGTFYLGTQLRQALLPLGAVLLLGRTRLLLASPTPPAGLQYSKLDHYGSILGGALAMRRLYAVLERIEQTEFSVLIQGESGVGKELVAKELHRRSPRRQGPYEILDCAAIPGELAESELFGHIKGAFTGAHEARDGAFTRAHGGTLLLDEIGELPLELQPKLLRVLESRRLRPVGGGKPVEIDVRVLAATNRDLMAEVAAGRFRQDLFYRLNVVGLTVPPLRERREDVPTLVRHFLADMGGAELEVSADTLELLSCGYDWPGNVRELRNAVARVVSLGEVPDELAQASTSDAGAGEGLSVDPDQPYLEAKKRLLEVFERDYLESQLQRSGGNISQAARQAGIDRAYFKRLVKKHGLDG